MKTLKNIFSIETLTVIIKVVYLGIIFLGASSLIIGLILNLVNTDLLN